MDSYLLKKKTKSSYLERIATEPEATQRNRRQTIQNFEEFIRSEYDKTVENIVDEIHYLKKESDAAYDEGLYEMLQCWINWNEKKKMGNYTIRTMFSNLRKYLYYFGIKTNPQDIKENLRFGKKVNEERYPLSQEEYRAIIEAYARNPRRQALFLALGSSGMRIGEAMKIRKMDLDLSTERIKVNIRPETKTKQGRSTFISKEAADKIRPILEKLAPDDLVFCKSKSKFACMNESKSLREVVERLGMTDKYSSNNFNKITSHSFRAYFFTKAARKHGENYAHRMVGHGGYLMQYDRITEEDKLRMYVELEQDLMIFDQAKNELEISRLRKENELIYELMDQIKKLKEDQAKQDKLILENLKKEGTIP